MFKRFMGCLIVIASLILITRYSIQRVTLKNSEESFYPSGTLNRLVKPSRYMPNNTVNILAMTTPLPVPVLYYHSVMQEANNEVRMPPDQFEEQITYLEEHGFHSISSHQLYESLYHESPLPPKPFVITFDDGYIDNYQTAFPILKSHGFVATVFMVSDFIDKKGFLTWSQLKELSAEGWDIEGHTADHIDLTKCDSLGVLNELKNSKNTLEKGLGHSVNFFAYPYGSFNNRVVKDLQDCGYLMAFTTLRGWAAPQTDAFHLHRVYCYANMGLKEFINRLEDPNY